MQKTGKIVGDVGLHGAAAAIVLYIVNMVTWAAVTAMLGGGLALIGLGLIVLALHPSRKQEAARQPEETEHLPSAEMAPA